MLNQSLVYLLSKTAKATFDFQNPSSYTAFQGAISKTAEEMCEP